MHREDLVAHLEVMGLLLGRVAVASQNQSADATIVARSARGHFFSCLLCVIGFVTFVVGADWRFQFVTN